MELELKKECLEVYDLCGSTVVSQEETAETIVPDYCPDIARIISTDGTIFIHSREVREGKGSVSGSVRVIVLYTPEGEHTIRQLEFSMPFTVESEKACFTNCICLSVTCKTETVESRLLNPRKVFTRCKLVCQMTGYQKQPLCFSSDLYADETRCMQKKHSKQRSFLLKHISEKDFTFTEVVSLSPGKQGASELVNRQICSTITEMKLIGNKLVFKGIFHIRLLYRGKDGQICTLYSELPFSQIMEMEEAVEDCLLSVEMQLTGVDVQIDGADAEGRDFAVTLYFHATAFIRECQELTVLDDLYSTKYECSYETAPIALCSLYEKINRRQTVREVLEIGTVATEILWTNIVCSAVSVSREGDLDLLRTHVSIQVLYLDEGGACLMTERSLEVTTQLEVPADCIVKAWATCADEAQATLGDHGIEVRFPVDFHGEITVKKKQITIQKASLDDSAVKDLAGAPSLVLRCLNREETAWELAKRYNTTISEILSANQLEREEDLPQEKLLLIPRKRA